MALVLFPQLPMQTCVYSSVGMVVTRMPSVYRWEESSMIVPPTSVSVPKDT